jgi:hypothetical protein
VKQQQSLLSPVAPIFLSNYKRATKAYVNVISLPFTHKKSSYINAAAQQSNL